MCSEEQLRGFWERNLIFVSDQLCLELWRIKMCSKKAYRSTIICSKKQCLVEEKRLQGTCCGRAQDFGCASGTPCWPIPPMCRAAFIQVGMPQMASVSSGSNSYLGFYKMTQTWPEPEISNRHSNRICELKLA